MNEERDERQTSQADPDGPQAWEINENTGTPGNRPEFDERREEIIGQLADGEHIAVDDVAVDEDDSTTSSDDEQPDPPT